VTCKREGFSITYIRARAAGSNVARKKSQLYYQNYKIRDLSSGGRGHR
jgi:hypothetical protein